MNTDLMFSSAKCEWETPQAFFDALDAEFGFAIDVCATADNAKCVRFFTPEMDGLKQEWSGVCWMNPPYGREMPKWIRKAFFSAKGGGHNGCLLASFAHRHGSVARILHERRDSIRSGAVEVWRTQQLRSIPICCRDISTAPASKGIMYISPLLAIKMADYLEVHSGQAYN